MQCMSKRSVSYNRWEFNSVIVIDTACEVCEGRDLGNGPVYVLFTNPQTVCYDDIDKPFQDALVSYKFVYSVSVFYSLVRKLTDSCLLN